MITSPALLCPPAISGSCHQVSTGFPSYCCTRKSDARVPAGDSGANQTSEPSSARIIGPYWPGPEYGAMKMSPGVVPAACAVTVTVGGCRSGRERKRWYEARWGAGRGLPPATPP